jgi:hypothetical protein
MSILQVFCLTVFFVSIPLLAQNSMSGVDNTAMTPTFNVGHDYIEDLAETVNPANGAVSVRIAAPTPKERGSTEPIYAYIYDTNGQVSIIPNFTSNDPNKNSAGYHTLLNSVTAKVGVGFYSTGGNFLTGAPQIDNDPAAFSSPGTLTKSSVSLSAGPTHTCQYWTNYIYTDAEGGKHLLPLFYALPAYRNANSCGYFGVTEYFYTSGGDGVINAVIDPNNGDAYVYDMHGKQLNRNYSVEDSNGNYPNTSGRAYGGTFGGTSGVMPSSLTIPGLGGNYVYSYPTILNQAPQLPVTLNATPFASNDSTCPSGFQNGDIYSSKGSTVITLPNGQNIRSSLTQIMG